MSAELKGAIQVKHLALKDADGARRWDAFVQRCPSATFFHLAAWQRIIRKQFGHTGYFLYAERDGVIEGVLPLAENKSRLFGHALVGLPFAVSRTRPRRWRAASASSTWSCAMSSVATSTGRTRTST